MLKMDHVSYGYKGKRGKIERLILQDITLEFEAGVLYAICGDSGIGKSTTLALLGGLEMPISGEILVDDDDIRNIGYARLRREYISFIFQNYHLFNYMTAVENTLMPLTQKRNRDNTDQAISILQSLGISHEELYRPVFKLSGGQKQRVAIARALITDAPYILADEPTGNLDKKNAIHIMEILQSLAHKKNKCIVVVTHSDLVKNMSDSCIVLDNLL